MIGKIGETHKIPLTVSDLSGYDTVVCGGGFAGAVAAMCAAENGARVLLAESGGELGGDITKSIVPQILDTDGKGGCVRELFAFLNAGNHTSPRRGARYDPGGNKNHGSMVDLEYIKYYLDNRCRKAGVDILYHSLICGVETDNDRITAVTISTECGNYRATANTFIDATGNGLAASLAGVPSECGHPRTGEPQPASASVLVAGIPDGFAPVTDNASKLRLKQFFADADIPVSAEWVTLVESACDGVWLLTFNNQYHVLPDDPFALSEATSAARAECIRVIDKMRHLPGFEKLTLLSVSSHIGIREGRRIHGKYHLTVSDIVSGLRTEDAVCTVRFPVDIHHHPDDTTKHQHGKKVIPYHLPFRALIAEGFRNLLLAGRCISGDFYAHASYRAVGNVISTGEATGYAAAIAAKSHTDVAGLDGRMISAYMKSRGYEI